MSKYTSNRSATNDGAWFLEAIGASPKAPSSSEALASLEAENTTVDDIASVEVADDTDDVTVELSSFDGDPGTSTASFHPVPAAPPPPLPLDDEPEEGVTEDPSPPPSDEEVDLELEPVVRSRRSFRWPVVIVLGLAIVAVAVAAFWLPTTVQDEAQAIRSDYYDAAFAVRDYLPSSQTALDAITDPASEPDAITATVPMIAELDSRAFALEQTTAQPLPTPLPLVPSGPIDELEPLQDRGSILGTASSDLSRRLGNAYVYRTSIPLLLDVGDLPTSATTEEVNALSVQIASTLASDAGVVADLPDDPAFAEVKTTAVAALERASQWQEEYLAALTNEDEAAATVLVNEIDEIQAGLASVTLDALIAFRTEADLAIVELAGEFDEYLVELAS